MGLINVLAIVFSLVGVNIWGYGVIRGTLNPRQRRWEITVVIGFALLMVGIMAFLASYAMFVGGKG